MKKLCVNCRNLFETARNVPHQSYCTDSSCQRARKTAWMSKKLASDSDYKTNQRRAQKNWQNANPYYWKKYRVHRDTLSQIADKRKKRRFQGDLDEQGNEVPNLDFNGLFELKILSQIRRVKIDVYIVELRRYKGFKDSGKNAKR